MSLIEEALRRVQDPTIPQVQAPPSQKGASASPPPAHSWQAPSAHQKDQWSRALPLVAAVIFLATGALVVVGAQWMRRSLSAPAAPSKPAPAAAQAPASTAQDAAHPSPFAAISKPAKQEEFALTGLVEGQGVPLAVINGDIRAVGDRVGSATLVEITDGSVHLRRDDGQELSLQLAR